MAPSSRSIRCGPLVREARSRKGWSQRELARRARTSQVQVSRIERDEISPTLESLGRILEALGLALQLETIPLGRSLPGASNESIAELRRSYRGLSAAERLAQAMELSEFATELAVAGARRRG